jgi:cyanophycinase-like exopeptidase
MNPHKKELLLAGGRMDMGGALYEYLADLAKPEGKIGFIQFASTDHARAEQKLTEVTNFFASKDIEVVDVKSVDDCYGLGVVHMHGGNPQQLVSKMETTGIAELLRPAWKYGDVVLGGSSAGAMALFWDMLVDKDHRLTADLMKGIGPMSGGLIIPHFDVVDDELKRDIVAKNQGKLIIGVDENTTLRWRMGVCDVLGSGKVTLLGRSSGVYGAGEEFDLASTKQ